MRSVVLLLCVALLAANVMAFSIFNKDHKTPKDDRVRVDFYYESLCPYCQQFIGRALRTAVGTQDFWRVCDFNLYPYGNARRTRIGDDDWSFTCQHGERECEGNLIETCAIRLNEGYFYTKALPYIVCLEGNTEDWNKQSRACAYEFGLDHEAISTCATSKLGRQFMAEIADATDKLEPAHTYVPWVVVNGVHSESTENAVQSNMVKYVCSIYKGSEKIAACN
jgi:interferon, gamma-inducible protein 30